MRRVQVGNAAGKAIPNCRKCGSSKSPSILGIPDRARGAGLLRGGEYLECPDCKNRIRRS